MFGYGEGRSGAESPVLEAAKLTKVVDSERVALSSVDLVVRSGEIKGLIASNSFTVKTLFELILGLKSPDAGMIVSGGGAGLKAEQSPQTQFGFLPEEIHIPDRMSGLEYLRLMANLSGMNRGEALSQIASVTERLGIGATLGLKCGSLHIPERRLLALAGATIHSPELLLLSEPIKEMDVFAEGRVKDFLKSTADAGSAILITSREMGAIEKLAQDLVVFSESQVVYDGPMSLVRRFSGRNVLAVEIDGLHSHFESALEGPVADGILAFQFDGDRYVIRFDEAMFLTEMLRVILEAAEESGVILCGVSLQTEDLGETVRNILINAPVRERSQSSLPELRGEPKKELPAAKDTD